MGMTQGRALPLARPWEGKEIPLDFSVCRALVIRKANTS